MQLFVYGSLKSGGKYHCYLEEASLVSEHASVNGVLYDSGLGYPAFVMSETEIVKGELYEIPEQLWPALDDLEGYAGEAATDLFDKTTILVEANGEKVEAVIYVANDPQLLKTKISSDTWDAAQSLHA
ncbi:gamma-glutamylcyclotransferase family protein [Planococcus sp. YIM B11945]|uniref:gamma-glutamylcyclotransferase family protein n=1 Tax=Planococcus sp. YIM B11945 TaxID=3435410 RepID=UPI003D7C5B0F